ncbi:vacuolar iron transporter homolog 1-like [Carica papaya]|uniref:vacuolar iron transporter homolog 1-like n=1 Tax=Carica papaya TaxID=3649 RepID=UPI000B8C7FE6|nr:vacuolar iron transporter homolog 1-like [Carica papaya]
MASSSPTSPADHKLAVLDPKNGALAGKRRAQWVRAAILGANDGLLSTAALMIGIGAAKEDRSPMLMSGLAGALAGSFSMAAGEFVSVSTQRDIEEATNNSTKLVTSNPKEQLPITSPARSPVMKVISAGGGAVREEALPNPYKAAAASALAFLCGSLVPLASAMFVKQDSVRMIVIAAVSSVALPVFGGIGAYIGGSPIRISGVRVLLGGWTAMGVTYGLLKFFNTDKIHETHHLNQ